jgi:6-pyruvoyltetrahydropterin/6-carboxytetrahydropterin synthase
MYYLKKTLEIAGAHSLSLPYESKCKNDHGHNWIITVYCKSDHLVNGMVIDFTKIKEIVNQLDHQYMNEFIEQPTAENMAKWLCEKIPACYKVTVQESSGNEVTYEI